MTPQEPITRDPTPDEIAVHEQQVIVAQTAIGIMRSRRIGQPRRETVGQSRQRRNRALARKVEMAGVRSAAGLSRRQQ